MKTRLLFLSKLTLVMALLLSISCLLIGQQMPALGDDFGGGFVIKILEDGDHAYEMGKDKVVVCYPHDLEVDGTWDEAMAAVKKLNASNEYNDWQLPSAKHYEWMTGVLYASAKSYFNREFYWSDATDGVNGWTHNFKTTAAAYYVKDGHYPGGARATRTVTIEQGLVTCMEQVFKVGDDKKIYQKMNGEWKHVGDRANKIYCERRDLFCESSSGGTWRYNGEAHRWTEANHLLAGQEMQGGSANQDNGPEDEHLRSRNGKCFFYVQHNGDLSIYEHNPAAKLLWLSNTAGHNNPTLKMQTDGNLVIYAEDGTAIWSSETHINWDKRYGEAENKPVKLVLEDNGTAVLYSATNKRIWTSADGKLPLN